MLRFALAANMYKPEAPELIKEAVKLLTENGDKVKIPSSYGSYTGADKTEDGESLYKDIDFLVVFGGDGTLIDRAKKAAAYNVPVIGVNLGRVGYLSSLEKDELDKLLLLNKGEFKTVKRTMLSVTANGREYTALNDAVFAEARASRMVNTEITVDGEKTVGYASTALIICTPTGSSGFNLSAGGPAVEASAPCLIMTPVCPHTTSPRSFVFDDNTVFGVKNVSTPDKTVYLTLDGAEDVPIPRNGDVLVRKSELTAQTVIFGKEGFASKILKRIGK